jgi:hypothetical protein
MLMKISVDGPFEIYEQHVSEAIMASVHHVLALFIDRIPEVKLIVHKTRHYRQRFVFECVLQLGTHKPGYWVKFYGIGASCESAVTGALAEAKHYLSYQV